MISCWEVMNMKGEGRVAHIVSHNAHQPCRQIQKELLQVHLLRTLHGSIQLLSHSLFQVVGKNLFYENFQVAVAEKPQPGFPLNLP